MPWRLVQNRVRGRGGREIDKFRGVEPPIDDDSGSEAWIGSVTRTERATEEDRAGCSEVILPDGRRMYLFEAIELAPGEILGRAHMARHGTRLGVLVKFLDAQRKYVLQAHPARAFAREMWGSDYGKEESWYVIGVRGDAPEPPYFILGFKEGVTRETLREAVMRGDDIDALEQLCHKITVKPGDAAFIGGGVPHALGEGCFVLEVQEPSDITVVPALYEKQKRRAADEDTYYKRMLGAFSYDGCSYSEAVKRYMIPRRALRRGDWGAENWIIGPGQTRLFYCSQADIKGRMPVRYTGCPQIAVALRGEGAFHYRGGSIALKRADELFLPYNIHSAAIEGDISVAFCHPEGALS
jgi:mannose-6-phosphate isomerase